MLVGLLFNFLISFFFLFSLLYLKFVIPSFTPLLSVYIIKFVFPISHLIKNGTKRNMIQKLITKTKMITKQVLHFRYVIKKVEISAWYLNFELHAST